MSLYRKVYQLIKATREKQTIPIIVRKEPSELLNNEVAFVAGGCGGIGISIVEHLLECGCKVIIGGTNKEKLCKCKEQLLTTNKQYQIETFIFKIDDFVNLKDNIKNIISIYGHIDIFINASGVHTENLVLGNIPFDEFDRVININLKGPYYTAVEIAEYMKNNNIRGHILFISSSRGSEPVWSPYGITKNAINSLVKGLAMQYIDFGITINGIAPGPTATKLIGINEGESIYSNETHLKRVAMPDEIAAFATLLVSDNGNMLPGEMIHISGGRGVFDIR